MIDCKEEQEANNMELSEEVEGPGAVGLDTGEDWNMELNWLIKNHFQRLTSDRGELDKTLREFYFDRGVATAQMASSVSIIRQTSRLVEERMAHAGITNDQGDVICVGTTKSPGRPIRQVCELGL